MENLITPLLTEADKVQLDKLLLLCNETRPAEIQREVRGIKWLSYWKATEFRITLLYTGLVIFNGILPKEVYEHFKLLCLAIRILSCRYHRPNIVVAKNLLEIYLEGCIDIYGIDSITSNFHAICHVVEDLELYNAILPDISSFPFENALGILKNLVRNGREPLSQIARRISELSYQDNVSDPSKISLSKVKFDDVGPFDKYLQVNIRDEFILRNDNKNGWFLTHENEIAFFNYAYYDNKKEIVLSASILNEKHDYFLTPFSSSKLDIFASDGVLQNEKYIPEFKEITATVALTHVKCKLFLLFHKNQLIFLPILHTFDTAK